MTEHKLRCGDTVLHRPSGQTWEVSFADYETGRNTGRMSWFGWPNGEARIEDCELVQACTDVEHERAIDGWLVGKRISGDHRRFKVAWLYRPAALLPEVELRVQAAKEELARAQQYLRDLRDRAGLTNEPITCAHGDEPAPIATQR